MCLLVLLETCLRADFFLPWDILCALPQSGVLSFVCNLNLCNTPLLLTNQAPLLLPPLPYGETPWRPYCRPDPILSVLLLPVVNETFHPPLLQCCSCGVVQCCTAALPRSRVWHRVRPDLFGEGGGLVIGEGGGLVVRTLAVQEKGVVEGWATLRSLVGIIGERVHRPAETKDLRW